MVGTKQSGCLPRLFRHLEYQNSSNGQTDSHCFMSAAPRWTLLDTVKGSALYAAMIAFVAVPIWIAQGFLALLGVTLG